MYLLVTHLAIYAMYDVIYYELQFFATNKHPENENIKISTFEPWEQGRN